MSMFNYYMLTACTLLCLLIFYVQRECWFFIWKLRGWRGIMEQPILWLLLFINLEPNNVMLAVKRCRKYFKSPVAVIVGTRILLYIDDPDTMEAVLTAPECLNKTFLQNGFFANKGLLHAKDEEWKIRRKQLNPTFSHKILLSFFNTFDAVGQEMQLQLSEMLLQAKAHKISFEALEDLISRAVLEVSCLTTMDTATHFTRSDTKGITKAYRTLMEISALRTIKPWLQIDNIFRWLNEEIYKKCKRCNKLVEKFVIDMVQRKLDEWYAKTQMSNRETKINIVKELKNSNNIAGINNPDGNNSNDVTDALVGGMNYSIPLVNVDSEHKRIFIYQLFHLAEMGELTLEEIVNETQSMVMVSFETVSTSIMNVLLCLAINREYQNELRNEIRQVLSNVSTQEPQHQHQQRTKHISPADNDNADDFHLPLVMENLQQMPYLDMIINESLRLLTTVPMNIRNVSKDIQLHIAQGKKQQRIPDIDKLHDSQNVIKNKRIVWIPKNTLIAMDTFSMQRDQSIWGPYAEKFYPKHFSKEYQECHARHTFAFIPFSKGLRTCIGSRYSIYVLKIFLIKLISRFDFDTSTCLENLEFVEGISLKLRQSKNIEFHICPYTQQK
uniref:Cytochrome P450 n=1 Tax=Glossina brevipalpis TaxID=37001 RepID=A0A1A9W6B7_9MUSC